MRPFPSALQSLGIPPFPKWPGSGPCIPSPWHQAPDLLGKAFCLQSGTLFPPGKAPSSLEGFRLQLDGLGRVYLGNGPSCGEQELGGRWSRGSHAGGLGTATHCLAVAGGERAPLCIGRGSHGSPASTCPHMGGSAPCLLCEPSAGLWQRLPLPHCLALQSDTWGLSHPCTTQ